ncbi:MAG: ZIP family metal transporter [Woeseiaceae bacterium]|nr:ZIP family metal transporter [Woeseiaceae bacterium]
MFVIRRLSPKLEDGLLSGAAGVMLAAAVFSLLLPALEYAELQYGSNETAVLLASAGLMIGAATLWLIHRYSPHEHFLVGPEGPKAKNLGRIWLFVIAITLHNFPEGMAVGVGFAGGDIENGVTLMAGIGFQNIPEGLAVSVSLMTVGYSRRQAFLIGLLSGLVEPVGGLFGSVAVSVAAVLIPWSLAFAAGAMLFIISDEIIPETHRRGFENLATFSLLAGFCVMLLLDALLT